MTHRQISSGRRPICTEQVCLKQAPCPATRARVCVCVCISVTERAQLVSHFHGQPFVHYIAILTQCHFVLLGCALLESEHVGLFTHIYLCHATPGQASAMQWLPWLNTAARLCAMPLSPHRHIQTHLIPQEHMLRRRTCKHTEKKDIKKTICMHK